MWSNLLILTFFSATLESETKCGAQFYETPKVIAAREGVRGRFLFGSELILFFAGTDQFKECWWRERSAGGGPWTDLHVSS